MPGEGGGETHVLGNAVFEKSVAQLKEKIRKSESAPLEAFKRFLKINEHRLLIAHNAGSDGKDLCRRRADLVDVVFRELFDCMKSKTAGDIDFSGIAVVAFGGYGRREMNPFSDVDIMFLTEAQTLDNGLGDFILRTTTALWDIGFKVGHSVRSISQSIAQANADLMTKTAMIECRCLTGNRALFAKFRELFEKSCLKGRDMEYLSWRLQNQIELHERFGASVYMQEPNVKNGCGGLRDCQNLLWVAYVKERVQDLGKLVDLSILRETEKRSLEVAYDFLLRVRTQMHYINGRPIDNLTLQLQGKVATAFNYPQKNILRRCEAFMRDYYQHTREILTITETAIGRMDLTPVSRRRSLMRLLRLPSAGVKFDGLVAKDGFIYPESRAIFKEDPSRMMRVFQHAQLRQLKLSTELKDLIRRRIFLVDRTFQYARVNREIFLAILSRKGKVGRIMREMHDTGFLGKYMPEFGALTCLVQHEFFHRYTADEHTLVCLEKLDSVLFSEENKLAGYRSLFQRLEDGAMLYLALLLHDTGKAANRRHHEEASAELARKVARRIQLSPERRKMLITLVDAHYSLSKTSQSRNLDDSVTITEFAGIVRNRPTLDSLMLLTLADGMGTSDQNWSDWKETLVWQLYRQTADYLETGPSAFERKEKNRGLLKGAVSERLPSFYEEELTAHFENMPERYFQAFDVAEIAEHLKLFHEFFEKLQKEAEPALQPVVRWIERLEQGHSEVWVCGWDRPALLERMAGAFVASKLNILSADVFTRADQIVIDIFRVCDLRREPVHSAKDKAFFEKLLAKSLETDSFNFTPHFQKETGMKFYRLSQEFDLPTRVVIENRLHPIYTLVEIQTPDRPGLLYDLLRAFNFAGVSIELSRITTEMDVAIDAFYVTAENGNKILDEQHIDLLQKLLQKSAVGESLAG